MMTAKVFGALIAGIVSTVTASCNFTNQFGSGENLDTEHLDSSFLTAGGAAVTCTVSCSGSPNGSVTELQIAFGGIPTDCYFDAAKQGPGCALTVSTSSPTDQPKFGWRLVSSGYFDLELHCECSQSYCGSCFSGDTTVLVQGKGEVAMRDLRVGDKVYSSNGENGQHKYQPIYSFGHQSDTDDATFFQIYTDNNPIPLEMTAQHLVFVMTPKEHKAVRADKLRVGDLLIQHSASGSHETVEVVDITTIQKQGIYMPLTRDGSILVNGGIKASAYVSIADEAPTVVANTALFNLDEQSLSHWWMSPYRMLCLGVSSSLCRATEKEGEILPYLLAGRQLAELAEPRGFFVRVIVLGVPTFLVFGMFNLVEWIFGGPNFAPMGVIVVGFLAYKKSRQWKNLRRQINRSEASAKKAV